jgi:hypothetical protein
MHNVPEKKTEGLNATPALQSSGRTRNKTNIHHLCDLHTS